MRKRRRSWWAAPAALLCASACAQILGSDGKLLTPAPPPDGGAAAACADGELRCDGVALQICRADRSGFRLAQVCSTPELCCAAEGPGCEQAGCALPACAAYDFRCDGAELSICNESQTGWDRVDVCGSAAQCNATLGRCTEQPCVAVPANSQFQCNGPVLEVCIEGGWQARATCETQQLCSPEQRSCQEHSCRVGEFPGASAFRCEGGDLQRCNDAQTGFQHVETCVNASSCIPLVGVAHGEVPPEQLGLLGCLAPSCTAGTYRCAGEELQRCNGNRTAYEREQVCASPSHCNASLGRCEDAPCSPGARQCSGNELLRCGEDENWQSERRCPPETRCNVETAGCDARVCQAGEHRCSGTTLERCNAYGTGWLGVHECATAELCNAGAKRCDRPVCEPEQRRCSRDGKLQTCAPGRDAWQDSRDCLAEAVPPISADSLEVAGLCDPVAGTCSSAPSCAAGAVRCNGPFLQRCEGNTWRPQERCATAALCNSAGMGSCTPATCEPGQYRCVVPGSGSAGAPPTVAEPNSPMLGLTLEMCNTAGTGFVQVQACTERYCDPVHGQCDICRSYEVLCSDGALELCSADGQEKELDQRCPAGCMSAPAAASGASTGRAACLSSDAGIPDSQQ